MLRNRTQGILAAGLGLVVAACGSPEIKTNLRPEGPPDILAVLTQSQSDLLEDAVYCRYVNGVRDPKAPGLVSGPLSIGDVCPATEAEFDPIGASNFGFAVRFMFDELLDGDRVETLDCDDDDDGVPNDPLICSGSFATTQPVSIACGPAGAQTELDYTGYYVPNGNAVTFPVGPSLYALPDLDGTAFATGTACTAAVKDSVVDKDGTPVPADQRSHTFNLQELALIGVSPVDGNETVILPSAAAVFVFNASIDLASIDPATETDLTTALGVPVAFTVDVDDTNADADGVYVFTSSIWRPGDYIAKIKAGASFAEVNGGTITFDNEVKTAFSVAFGRVGTVPAPGATIAPDDTITLYFNDSFNPTTVTADEFELVDPANNTVAFSLAIITDSFPNDTIEITPSANLTPTTGAQRYVLRVKASATFANPGGLTFKGPYALSFKVGA